MPLLPIFPLGTVLFPGSALPLHIFEERYRTMINACIERDEPFGVVLIREGVEAGGAAEPYDVGTTARITRVERMPDGRMNIVTVGGRRFRLLRADRSKPYLQAEVEYADRVEEATEEAEAAATRVRDLFSAYYRATLVLGDQWTRRVGLPSRPAVLADFVAGRLDAEPPVKQELLEISTVHGCLEREASMLESEVGKLATRVEAMHRQRFGGFGALN